MHFTTLFLASVASVASAQVNPNFRFSSFGYAATGCEDNCKLLNPSINIPGTGDVTNCIQFPPGTSAVQYKSVEKSRIGCKVELWTNNACNGPAGDGFTPDVGSTTCKPPRGAGWQSVKVTCP